jgi:hypothetical protein
MFPKLSGKSTGIAYETLSAVIRQPDPAIHKDELDKRDNAGDWRNKKTAARATHRASGESGKSL